LRAFRPNELNSTFMKFSIILPVYNASKTIARTLDSIVNQTFKDFEVIIIDDGSNDDTAKICFKYAETDKRFRYYFQQNNGVSSARNKGIELSNGEFVAFIDSDDIYKTTYLETFNTLICTYPDYDNYWCRYTTRSDITQTDIGTFSTIEYLKSDVPYLHSIVLDAALWNKAYKKSIIVEHSIKLPEDISLGEDLIFNYHYLDETNGKILLCENELYVYTVNQDSSLDSKYREDLYEIQLRLLSEAKHYYDKWEVSNDSKTLYYNSIYFSLEKVLYNVYRKECILSRKEKNRLNNQIIGSAEFQEALKLCNCRIHPLYRFGYKIKSWQFIDFLNRLSRILK